MLSKNKAKFIKSLQLKKFRQDHGKFIVEGEKSVNELLLSDIQCYMILGTSSYLSKNNSKIRLKKEIEVIEIDEKELSALSTFENNNSVLAVAGIVKLEELQPQKGELMIALDGVRDPGNMGTIIRTADWYGVKKIVCSESCVEVYNPKVINSTMGSFTRVKLYYCDLEKYLSDFKGKVLGAFLSGENIHQYKYLKTETGILLMGNESNGISQNLEKLVTEKITIPSYGKAESLNVSISTAIILDNLRR